VSAVEHDSEEAGRRVFLRRLGGQAVEGTGRLVGLSGAIRRSVVAAAGAVARDLDPPHPVEPIEQSEPSVFATVPASKPVTTVPPAPRPAVPLTPEREAFLRSARSGVLAVNDPGRPPHVSRVVVTWIDEVFTMPTGMFSARANAIDRDPQVSLLVEDPEAGGGRWVAVAGIAALEPEPMSADRAVIIIRPTRITWQIG
jgi:hypothetical protein